MILFSPISFTRAPHHNFASGKELYCFFHQERKWTARNRTIRTLHFFSGCLVFITTICHSREFMLWVGWCIASWLCFTDLLEVSSASCASGEDHKYRTGKPATSSSLNGISLTLAKGVQDTVSWDGVMKPGTADYPVMEDMCLLEWHTPGSWGKKIHCVSAMRQKISCDRVFSIILPGGAI